jgi:hypothetical protein
MRIEKHIDASPREKMRELGRFLIAITYSHCCCCCRAALGGGETLLTQLLSALPVIKNERRKRAADDSRVTDTTGALCYLFPQVLAQKTSRKKARTLEHLRAFRKIPPPAAVV